MKQEQIREIEEVICNMKEWAARYYDEYGYEHEAFANCSGIAAAIYNAGYRKADEVRKETAKDICDWLEYCFKLYDYWIEKLAKDRTKAIRKKYGVEVKK